MQICITPVTFGWKSSWEENFFGVLRQFEQKVLEYQNAADQKGYTSAMQV
ncbi:hypothetical protein [Desulforamulus putei]